MIVLKSSSFSRRENSVSQETSISQSVQNPIQNNPTPILQIKFAALTEYAQKPKRGSEFSAGIDLRSAYEYLVPANGNKLIKTDWKIQYPDGYFGKNMFKIRIIVKS